MLNRELDHTIGRRCAPGERALSGQTQPTEAPTLVAAGMPQRAWSLLSHNGETYEWCVASDWIKLRRVGAGKNFTKQWKPRRSGEAYTEAEALSMVTEFLGRPSAGSSAVADAARSTGLFDDISETLADWPEEDGAREAAAD